MENQRPVKPSGIPRPSRLPLPTGKPDQFLRPSPSRERLQADRGLNVTRLRRPSEEALRRRYSRSTSPAKSFNESRGQPVFRLKSQPDSQLSSLPDDQEDFGSVPQNKDDASITTPSRPKPTLSERTVGTLSQIPSASPSRRTSTLFMLENPIGPPRPASTSRTPSLPLTPRKGSTPSSRVAMGHKVPSAPVSPGSLAPKRSVSMSRDAVRGHTADVELQARTNADSESGNGTYSVGRSLSSLPSLRKTHGESTGPTKGDVHQGAVKPSLMARKKSPSLSARPVRTSVPKPSSDASTVSQGVESESRKGNEVKNMSKSSNALRESIAKAKAARKAALAGNAKPKDPFDIEFEDPFGQKSISDNGSVLRNRVATARKSGHLNISALSLREIPHEVMTMYEFDPESSSDWYENVDLVKFIAADNEIETLSDAAFPDIDFMSVSLDDDVQGGQFGGLEVLDVHGNLLSSLPIGIRRLQRLQSLNLSNNRFSTEVFDVIREIQCLTELRLANNDLVGSLPPSVMDLSKLEVLDLHGNSLTELRGALRNLSCLRTVNVAENQLASIPFDEICGLPLTEINAQRNKLTGYLIPASVDSLPALQTLNVTGNNLEKLTEGDSLDLPSVRQLFAAGNRIDSLPDVSSWQALLTINMEDNKLSKIPPGFPSLKNLRHCDFTGCDIRILDNSIGLMDNLISFRVANNPLRERKFLSMDIEDLKLDLRSRCAPETIDTEEEDGSVQTEFTMAPESPPRASGWRLKPGGILDRSSTEASELDCVELQSLASSADVRCLYLRRNMFECLPVPALSLIAHSLTVLDLSYNPLNSAGVITKRLSLPHLQSLTLSFCKLNSLDSLFSFVYAPSLTLLDVSNNFISGPLPAVRKSYPNLATFLAAENQIESLDFEAVRGLQVLDVSNNNIGSLPPKLGLLSPEEVGNRCSGLRRLDVSGNSFRVPRWQIVSKGTEAVLEWLKNRIPDEELQRWQDEGI